MHLSYACIFLHVFLANHPFNFIFYFCPKDMELIGQFRSKSHNMVISSWDSIFLGVGLSQVSKAVNINSASDVEESLRVETTVRPKYGIKSSLIRFCAWGQPTSPWATHSGNWHGINIGLVLGTSLALLEFENDSFLHFDFSKNWCLQNSH